ncbi:DUF7504 family protein [Haloferax volcanii]|uniref:Recombinase RecA n=3 Tax=Haloferax volcanii TaxID=2246 RepID=A0A8D4BAF1_HALVD|nr:hypothetical protein [Haloferax volcanii]ADE04507.2 uncharacterized protein HVO_2967 [Haloferax volcanii DS2]ELY24572.1 hypothetical protein C498_17995 [Haloferax volcanii DS2]MBS8118870.1 hypothetical protein [Haloferax volcanii]MBS8123884.1 hypothetical protein [Haloferax volcanii]MBS8127753.1 hypothetical protein [Haloferax volcanii]
MVFRPENASPATQPPEVSLPDSGSVLIAGPTMTRKRRLMLSILAPGERTDAGTVVVTTKKPAPSIARELSYISGSPPEQFEVIDTTSVADLLDDRADAGNLRYVSSPGDLTGIGIHLTESLREHYEASRSARVGLHVLSTLVMYTDLKRLFQFLHVITGRISAAGFTGVFTLDTGFVDERELALLKQPFDGFVETRDTDGDPEFRVRGLDDGPRSWTPLRI